MAPDLTAVAAVAPVIAGLAVVAGLQHRWGLAAGATLIAVAFVALTLIYR